VIEDGVNGRLVAPGDPAPWARAVEELMASDDLRLRMGLEGRRTAMRFDRAHHVERVLDAYRDVLDGRDRVPACR
jgi:glycosyltransferase involved in cell wall biosynthesis